MDENRIILDRDSQYSLTEGETRVIDIYWDELPSDSIPSYKWTSESPDIVSITEDGSLTALSSGTGRILLSVTGGSQTETTEYTIAVESTETAEEAEDVEVAEETEAEEADVEEVAEEADAEEADVEVVTGRGDGRS